MHDVMQLKFMSILRETPLSTAVNSGETVMVTPIYVFFRRRLKTHVPMLQVWTAEKPHPQEEVSKRYVFIYVNPLS